MAHRDPAREAGSLQREAALVLRGEVAELGLDVAVLPQAPVVRVHEVADDDLLARGAPARVGEADEEVPVGELVQARVEASDLADERGAGHDRRGAAQDVVPPQEPAHVGRRRRGDSLQDIPGRVHGDHRPVDELRPRAGRVELGAELARRPEVVVVEERDPLSAGSLDPVVQRHRLAALAFAKDRPHPRVGNRFEPLVAPVVGRVVDHDHLELDADLGERARERVAGQELPPVPRGDDDRDLGCGHRRESVEALSLDRGHSI